MASLPLVDSSNEAVGVADAQVLLVLPDKPPLVLVVRRAIVRLVTHTAQRRIGGVDLGTPHPVQRARSWIHGVFGSSRDSASAIRLVIHAPILEDMGLIGIPQFMALFDRIQLSPTAIAVVFLSMSWMLVTQVVVAGSVSTPVLALAVYVGPGTTWYWAVTHVSDPFLVSHR